MGKLQLQVIVPILMGMTLLLSPKACYSDSGLKDKYIRYRNNFVTNHIRNGLVSEFAEVLQGPPCNCIGINPMTPDDCLCYSFGDQSTLMGIAIGSLALDFKNTRNPNVLNALNALLDGFHRLDTRPDNDFDGYFIRHDQYTEPNGGARGKLDPGLPNGSASFDSADAWGLKPSVDQYAVLAFGLYLAEHALREISDPSATSAYSKVVDTAAVLGDYLKRRHYLIRDLQGGNVPRGPDAWWLTFGFARTFAEITGGTFLDYYDGTFEIDLRQLRQLVEVATDAVKSAARLELEGLVRCRIPALEDFEFPIPPSISVDHIFWETVFTLATEAYLQIAASPDNCGGRSIDVFIPWLASLRLIPGFSGQIIDGNLLRFCIPEIPLLLGPGDACVNIEIPELAWQVELPLPCQYETLHYIACLVFSSEDLFDILIDPFVVVANRNALWAAMRVYRGKILSPEETEVLFHQLTDAPTNPGIPHSDGEWIQDYKWIRVPYHLATLKERINWMSESGRRQFTGLDFMLPYLLAYGSELQVGD